VRSSLSSHATTIVRCRLEYEHINYVTTGRSAPLVKSGGADSGNKFIITNITAKEAKQLQPLGSSAPAPASATATAASSAADAKDKPAAAAADTKAAPAPASASAAPTSAAAADSSAPATPLALDNGYVCYTQSIAAIHKQLAPKPARVCVLDMRATAPLRPSDFDVFDTFVFGGVLGDHPPKDRAKILRELGFTTRSLGTQLSSAVCCLRHPYLPPHLLFPFLLLLCCCVTWLRSPSDDNRHRCVGVFNDHFTAHASRRSAPASRLCLVLLHRLVCGRERRVPQLRAALGAGSHSALCHSTAHRPVRPAIHTMG
jgi:hypothetical protein